MRSKLNPDQRRYLASLGLGEPAGRIAGGGSRKTGTAAGSKNAPRKPRTRKTATAQAGRIKEVPKPMQPPEEIPLAVGCLALIFFLLIFLLLLE